MASRSVHLKVMRRTKVKAQPPYWQVNTYASFHKFCIWLPDPVNLAPQQRRTLPISYQDRLESRRRVLTRVRLRSVIGSSLLAGQSARSPLFGLVETPW